MKNVAVNPSVRGVVACNFICIILELFHSTVIAGVKTNA